MCRDILYFRLYCHTCRLSLWMNTFNAKAAVLRDILCVCASIKIIWNSHFQDPVKKMAPPVYTPFWYRWNYIHCVQPKNFLLVNLVPPWFCPYFLLLKKKNINIKQHHNSLFPYNYAGAIMSAEILGAWLAKFCMVASNIFSKITAVPFLT